jgi:hypothetical protein
MRHFTLYVVMLLSAFLAALLISLAGAIPTWLLWNWLCPDLFHLPTITLIQAWGINFLAALLFKPHIPSKSE